MAQRLQERHERHLREGRQRHPVDADRGLWGSRLESVSFASSMRARASPMWKW